MFMIYKNFMKLPVILLHFENLFSHPLYFATLFQSKDVKERFPTNETHLQILCSLNPHIRQRILL